ncbi:hypothetical protein FS837_006531 [Tulasnella sp. UAMH 9824]|nr:hypothetical protein FS837_006531 [Tulasnella sp. UAMH 9824]
MLVSTLITTFGLVSSAQAWGDLGHKTVANVALQFLPPNVVSSLDAILAADGNKRSDDPTIVDVASWADDFDHQKDGSGDFSKEFHFIDAQDDPPFQCGIDLNRDCSGPNGCVVKAIANYTQQLVSPNGNPDDMAEALKFVVHFLGDVTQPLHAEAYERGGNGINVKFNGHKKRLHGVWDTDIITKLAGPDNQDSLDSWTNSIVTEINSGIYKDLVSQWISCTDINDAINCATQWAIESNAFVCSYVLATDPAGKELSGSYYRGAAPIVQEQIAKGGVRLAIWLNQIFGSGQPGQLPQAADRLLVQNRDL